MDVASAPVKETLGATGTQEVNSLFNYKNCIIKQDQPILLISEMVLIEKCNYGYNNNVNKIDQT